MKKILTFVAAMMAIASCGVMPKERERLVLQNNFDFRRCIENGFVISPYSCHRDCVPIARLDIAVIPAKEFEQETKRVKKMKSVDTSERAGESKFQDGIYNKAVNPKVVKFETQTVTYKGDHISTEIISNEELLDIAMSFIDYYGADALYDFRCEKIYNSVFSKSVGYTKIFDHYSITGVCVKYADPSQVAGGELLSLRSTGTKTGQ